MTVLFVLYATLAIGVPSQQTMAQRLDLRALVTTAATPSARLGPFLIDPHTFAAAEYIHATTEPHQRILSVTGRHDKIFINNIAIYFLAARLPGTSWHHYDPGIQTTQTVQREIIQDIETNEVRTVLRDPTWDNQEEMNLSAVSSGVNLIDHYITSHFAVETTFGNLTVMRRVRAPEGQSLARDRPSEGSVGYSSEVGQ